MRLPLNVPFTSEILSLKYWCSFCKKKKSQKHKATRKIKPTKLSGGYHPIFFEFTLQTRGLKINKKPLHFWLNYWQQVTKNHEQALKIFKCKPLCIAKQRFILCLYLPIAHPPRSKFLGLTSRGHLWCEGSDRSAGEGEPQFLLCVFLPICIFRLHHLN